MKNIIYRKAELKCHGHGCPDNGVCPLYTSEHVLGDNEQGDNGVDCEMKDYGIKKQ